MNLVVRSVFGRNFRPGINFRLINGIVYFGNKASYDLVEGKAYNRGDYKIEAEHDHALMTVHLSLRYIITNTLLGELHVRYLLEG